MPAKAPPRVLTPGDPIEEEIAPQEIHVYQLALQADDFVEIRVEQQGIDVAISLLNPSQEVLLIGDQRIGDLGPERLLAVAERSGSYQLEIKAWKSRNPAVRGYRASLETGPATEANRLRARAAGVFSKAEQLSWEFDSGPTRQALELYDQAIELWIEAQDDFWLAVTLAGKGDAFQHLRQWRQSIAPHEQAAKLFRDLAEDRFEAISLKSLAFAFWNLAELDRAFALHERALMLREKVGDRLGMGIAHQGMAEIYKVRGEKQDALVHFLQALELFDQPDDESFRAVALHNLGTLYRRAGKREEALDYLQEAEAVFASISNPRRQASSLSQIGQLVYENGEHDKALEILGKAYELYGEAKDRRQAGVLSRIGSVHRELGDPQKARECYLQALELLREKEIPRTKALVLAGLAALEQGEEQTPRALDYYLQALTLFQEIGDPVGQAESLLGVAISQRTLGDLEAARRSGQEALAIAEDLRVKPLSEDLRLSFFSTAQRSFDFYIDLLMELNRRQPEAGYSAQAFEVSERARARSLLDLLNEADAEIRGDAAPDLLDEERTLQRQLNAASIELMDSVTVTGGRRDVTRETVRRILLRLDAVRGEIRRKSPRYAALTQPVPLTLSQVQEQVLDRDTLLLEYKLGRERSYLWLVGRDDFASFELSPSQKIEDSVRRAHALLSQGPRRESEVRTQALLCDLSRELLQPVASMLNGKKLAIVAEGALQYLPFAALPDLSKHSECENAPPLAVAHEISYLPSASTLAVLRREAERRVASVGEVAILADPVFSPSDERVSDERVSGDPEAVSGAASTSYRRLAHSRQEAASILSLVPAERSYLGLDFEASKQAVLAGDLVGYRIVHFATHGILDSRPELSGVVLSLVNRSGEPIDGFLRAHEIYNLQLPAELVVLGACETALGKNVRGEGLIGLTRGFMYAGASRVMVSLWRVSDRSTADLMVEFYRSLLDRQLPPDAALREAQLAVREHNPHPFYWAGFVLQGQPGA